MASNYRVSKDASIMLETDRCASKSILRSFVLQRDTGNDTACGIASSDYDKIKRSLRDDLCDLCDFIQ